MSNEALERRISAVRNRLSDFGKVKTTDRFGITKEEDGFIFKDEQLESFINQGCGSVQLLISWVNDDAVQFQILDDIIVQYAVIQSLSAKALEERGREFQLKENSTDFNLPKISDMLFVQYQLETDIWMRKIDMLRMDANPVSSPPPVSEFNYSNGGTINIRGGNAGGQHKSVLTRTEGGNEAIYCDEDGSWKAVGKAGTITTFGSA